jgi:small subunit ribosomal protein S15
MFKACLAQSKCFLFVKDTFQLRPASGLRTIPSSSRATVSSIHSSSILLAANRRKSQARTSKKLNTARREERQRNVDAKRPHVVLGTRPGEDATWENCDLAKVLIDEGDLVKSTEPQLMKHSAGTISLPKYLGYGVGEAEKEMLFENLPALSAEADILQEEFTVDGNEAWVAQRHSEAEKRELSKANNFAKVLDLRNANAGGIAYENRRRIITEFSGPDNPFDTGRPEVQGM